MSTLPWLLFAPGALLIGLIARHHGIQSAGWLIALAAFSFPDWSLGPRAAIAAPDDQPVVQPTHLANLAV